MGDRQLERKGTLAAGGLNLQVPAGVHLLSKDVRFASRPALQRSAPQEIAQCHGFFKTFDRDNNKTIDL